MFGGRQVKKFEKIFSDSNLMSLEGGTGPGGSHVWRPQGVGAWGGSGRAVQEVQCITASSLVNKQTNTTENITFPQLCWRAVKIVDFSIEWPPKWCSTVHVTELCVAYCIGSVGKKRILSGALWPIHTKRHWLIWSIWSIGGNPFWSDLLGLLKI